MKHLLIQATLFLTTKGVEIDADTRDRALVALRDHLGGTLLDDGMDLPLGIHAGVRVHLRVHLLPDERVSPSSTESGKVADPV